MVDLFAPDYQVARFVLERGIALLYVIAFLVAAQQFPALCGERGLTPASRLIRRLPFRRAPSLFHWGYSDRRLRVVAWSGVAIGLLLILGLPQQAPLPITMLTWFGLWVLYQSIVNVGGTFYGFGWESLLLEAGFLAMFLGNDSVAPPWPVILAFRWLAFRVEFGAGLIKLRGDRCWRELTCMEWHHETQPLPNPLSWFFHRLPRTFHRLEAIGNFGAQLVLPFALFLPQPIASIAAILMIGTQLYLVVSGNYAWLNWITIFVCAAGIADPVITAILPFLPLPGSGPIADPAPWFIVVLVLLAVLIVILSWWPVRNMASPGQAMNASFNSLHIVNTYGAFGSVGRVRHEVIVEGSAADDPADESAWREYEFKAKPGDVRRVSPQVAPYHLRLDWAIWFIPLSSLYGEDWFMPFLTRLLEGDRGILQLMGRNPFQDAPPRYIRARLFRYRFTTWRERRETGAWWVRTFAADLVPPIRLRAAQEA